MVFQIMLMFTLPKKTTDHDSSTKRKQYDKIMNNCNFIVKSVKYFPVNHKIATIRWSLVTVNANTETLSEKKETLLTQ